MSDISNNLDGSKHPRRHRWRLAASFILRMVLTGLLILVVYAIIPVEGSSGMIATGVAIVAAMAIYTATVLRMLERVTRSESPMMLVGEAVMVAVLLFVAIFALAFASISKAAPESFNVPLDKTAALYFAMTVTSTVGFGDIIPVANLTRWVVTFQMLVNLIVLGAAIRAVAYAAQVGVQSRKEERGKTAETARSPQSPEQPPTPDPSPDTDSG